MNSRKVKISSRQTDNILRKITEQLKISDCSDLRVLAFMVSTTEALLHGNLVSSKKLLKRCCCFRTLNFDHQTAVIL